jgi:hypothetical protein
MHLCSLVLLSTILHFYTFNFTAFNDMTHFNCESGSSVGIATDYGMEVRESNPGGGEI